MSELITQADTAANLLQELIIHRRGPKLDNELRADVQVAQQTIIKMASHIKELEQENAELKKEPYIQKQQALRITKLEQENSQLRKELSTQDYKHRKHCNAMTERHADQILLLKKRIKELEQVLTEHHVPEEQWEAQDE